MQPKEAGQKADAKIAKELKEQTKKWLERLEKELDGVEKAGTGKLPDAHFKAMVTNMLAYVKDARHFLDKKDYVRSFEACIYAWGIYETLQTCNLITTKRNATK